MGNTDIATGSHNKTFNHHMDKWECSKCGLDLTAYHGPVPVPGCQYIADQRWHIHSSGQSRDCDGLFSYGSDNPGDPENDTDIGAINWALSGIWIFPDDESGQTEIVMDTDVFGRVTVQSGIRNYDGYQSRLSVICDRDDYDPEFSGYRDHRAESAGY